MTSASHRRASHVRVCTQREGDKASLPGTYGVGAASELDEDDDEDDDEAASDDDEEL